MALTSNFSRLHIENFTDLDITVMQYENGKDFPTAQVIKAAVWGGLALASITPIGGFLAKGATKVASKALGKTVAKNAYTGLIVRGESAEAAISLGYAERVVSPGAQRVGALVNKGLAFFTPFQFAKALNETFNYGGDVENIRPKPENSYNLKPGQSQYIVDRDTKLGINNGVKDIITGITLKSNSPSGILTYDQLINTGTDISDIDDLMGKQVGVDLGLFAIDNPFVGKPTAWWATPGARQISEVSNSKTTSYSETIPNTNIEYTFTYFGNQYDPSIDAEAKTWSLTFTEDGNSIFA